MNRGTFVISLDFELMWGVRDKKTVEDYGTNVSKVYDVIPKLLDIFNSKDVKATFATVGFLFAENSTELIHFNPKSTPNYINKTLNPYSNNNKVDVKGEENLYFAKSLLDRIKLDGRHEIASHTFSHYYCLEKGQNIKTFNNDINSAIRLAQSYSLELKSMVFPRNQFNPEYLDVIKNYGFICYRGNEKSWIYSPSDAHGNTRLKRMVRLLDAYLNITGHNTYREAKIHKSKLVDIPASRFLRPYDKKLFFLEKIRLRRIKRSMTYAAKNQEVFHLWWHPHNFGANTTRNFNFLKLILDHYTKLNKRYNFESKTMGELAEDYLKYKKS